LLESTVHTVFLVTTVHILTHRTPETTQNTAYDIPHGINSILSMSHDWYHRDDQSYPLHASLKMTNGVNTEHFKHREWFYVLKITSKLGKDGLLPKP